MSKRSDPLLICYLVDSLSPMERRLVERRLQEEAPLRQELAELREVMGLMAYGEALHPAPASLRARILDAARACQAERSMAASASERASEWAATESAAVPSAAAESKASINRDTLLEKTVQGQGLGEATAGWTGPESRRRQRTQRRRWRPQWSMGAIAASLLLSLGLGWHNFRLQQQLTALQVDQRETEFLTLVNADAQSASQQGKVVLDEHAGKILVVAQQLPILPEDETYYLWAVLQESEIFCGEVVVKQQGTTIAELSVDPALYSSELVEMHLVRAKRGKLPLTHHKPFPQDEQIVLVTTST